MRFLVDMPLSVDTAAWLRTKGHDAVHLRDQGLQRLPDDQIIQKAKAEGRVIVTMDVGFSHLLAFARESSPSMVLLRIVDARPQSIHQLLDHALPLLDAELQKGAIAVVEEHAVRVHRLPIQESSSP